MIRKDPKYVGRAKTVREFERARLKGDEKTAMEYFSILEKAGIFVPKDRLMNHTGIGSVLYANGLVTAVPVNMQQAAKKS